MKTFTLVIFLLAAAAAAITPPPASAGNSHWGRPLSVVNSLDLGTFTPVNGASTLVRDWHGVRMTYHTSGLEPGGTYTAWWVVFNRPERCSDGVCDEDDIFVNPEPARTSVLWAAGSIAGHDGIAAFDATLDRREMTGEVLFGPGLVRPFGAEIHVVIRAHGQPVTGAVDLQLSTFGGACDINHCEDVQAAIHPPVRRYAKHSSRDIG